MFRHAQFKPRVKCALYSFSSKTYNYPLTLNTVFSENNKSRVQHELSRLPSSYVPREDLATSRRSAVLIPLCFVDGEPSVLFTLRSRAMSKHRGEVSFPGGMEDQKDGGNPVVTATREAYEELGIPKERIQVWGCLSQLPSTAKGQVTTIPVLAFCDIKLSKLDPNPSEVDSFFTRTIASCCDPKNVRSTQFRTKTARFDDGSGKEKRFFQKGYTMPVYTPFTGQPYEYKIWGLTALILHLSLKTLLGKDLYKFEIKFIS